MSLKGLTWDQMVHKLNNGEAYGRPISIELLRKICEKGELRDISVHFILEVYLASHPTSLRSELIRSLIRNPYISLDSKIEALSFFFFKMNSMKKSDSKKRALASEVLSLCKASPRHRLKVLAMVEEIRLKESSRHVDQGDRAKSNVVSQEINFLTGISTRDFSKYESNISNFNQKKGETPKKPVDQSNTSKELTIEKLAEYFNNSSTTVKTLRSVISSRLNEPWGADIDSILWNLKNLGDFDWHLVSTNIDVVEEFFLEYFQCQKFLTRLTSKPLLNSDIDWTNFPEWREHYGRSFLLSERNFVPKEFINVYDTFQSFLSKVNPADLFLRKTFGLSYRSTDKQVHSFLYFLKTPNLNKRNAGKFLVVIFYGEKMPKRLMTFLRLQDISSYLNTHMKTKNILNTKISNCYVKECNRAEDAIEILALLQLEVPFQFHDRSHERIHVIEKMYPVSELRKRQEFLNFLSRKKLAIARSRNRESDVHCINCNQPLTDKLSRIRGYGPECWRKLKHLNITTLDMKASADVFERYATQDFEGWLRQVQSLVRDLLRT